jgi:hypothetical protein
MAPSNGGKGTPTPHVPMITADQAMKRLQRLLEEISHPIGLPRKLILSKRTRAAPAKRQTEPHGH